MAFIIFFLFCLKKFEKVEKTGIISTKFSFRCTPSVILGLLHIFKIYLIYRWPFSLPYIGYFSNFLYCAFGRPYAQVVTPDKNVTISALKNLKKINIG